MAGRGGQGEACFGLVRCGMAGLSRYGGAGSGREWIGGRGMVGSGRAGLGEVWLSKEFCFFDSGVCPESPT